MIGKTVSHYRIVGSLGAGGMGVVYAGEDIRLHRPVALKFVPEELAKDRSAVERLNSEARTASNLNHPNICTIYDIGEHEGQPFIVMELLKGQTLRERLESALLKIRDVVEIGIQVADALDAAHQRSVIHRDIKPANLFLVDRGQVKVLDFGLAKLVSRRTDIAVTAGVTRDRTADGLTLGTVAYMSPEQVNGDDLDGRTDLFSLGIVLYEALTGHQPFTGKTSAVVFSAILTRAPVAPVVLNPEVPPRLQEVVNNCLEKDRELRYQNAADLRADLKRVRRDMESGQSGVFRTTGSIHAATPDEPTHAITRETTSKPASVSADSATRTAAVGGSGSVEQVRRANYTIIGAVAVAAAVVIAGAMWLRPRNNGPAPATGATSAPQSVRTQLAAATASLEAKDYRAALTYAEEALRLSPDDRDAIRVREAARAILARFDEAVAQAGQRLAQGDAQGATSALDAARAIDPTAPILADLSARIAALPRTRTSETARRAEPPSPSEAARQRPPASSPAPTPPPTAAAPAPPEPIVSRTPSRESSRPTDPSAQPAPVSQAPPTAPPPAAPPVVAPSRPTPAPEPAAANPPPAARPDAAEHRESAAAPSRPQEADEAAIRRVIGTYARAIETKDLPLFRSVKPNMTADEQRRVEAGFRAVTSQQVAITVTAINVRGQDATVQLRRRDTIQAGGRQQTSESLQTMALTRAASGWVIQEIGR